MDCRGRDAPAISDSTAAMARASTMTGPTARCHGRCWLVQWRYAHAAVLGGLTYVAGVAFYKWHALRFHNAIWHGFVALAAGLHFAAIAHAVAS